MITKEHAPAFAERLAAYRARMIRLRTHCPVCDQPSTMNECPHCGAVVLEIGPKRQNDMNEAYVDVLEAGSVDAAIARDEAFDAKLEAALLPLRDLPPGEEAGLLRIGAALRAMREGRLWIE